MNKINHKKSVKICVKIGSKEVRPKTEDKILTPMRPYKIDALFEEVEKEMEDLMEEMRGKIRK